MCVKAARLFLHSPLAEVVLVFAVFFIHGAVPVPNVNEPYYLGKAIHYWNPDWARGDFFLDSADTHQVFYFTFGWLALWLSLTVLGWFGRVLTWSLMAWAWRRLSFAVIPRRWCSVLTAASFVCLVHWCNMAGEWVVGGVEAKGFAFVLVFLGVEALLRDRWNCAWLLLGAATAFHVLVGGWSIVAAALAWLLLGKDRPPLRPMWPALIGGALLSLPGIIPSAVLNWGVQRDVVRLANQVYVYGRLAHHLDPGSIRPLFIARFALLLAVWLVLCRVAPREAVLRRLSAFVAAAVAIAVVGVAISPLAVYDRALAAGLLRFYWFRLADVAVPMGVALAGTSFLVWQFRERPAVGRRWLAVAAVLAGSHLGVHAWQACSPQRPPADRLPHYVNWRRACNSVARSETIPPEARFLTPRMAQTFKWYAGRSEVANWKEIPQDAAAIVQWWRRIEDLHATGSHRPDEFWRQSLAEQGAERLKELGAKYGADYAITVARPLLPLEVVYRNRSYIIYRLDGVVQPPADDHKAATGGRADGWPKRGQK